MRKYLLILFTLVSAFASAQTFPDADSLLRYNDQYIRNSAITAFTNNRLNTLLKGIIEKLGSGGGGGSANQIQLRNNGTFIQWKYTNQSDFFWVNLISVASLTGPQGPQGVAGANGAPGAPGSPGAQGPAGPAGPSVELQNNGTYIQYRSIGSSTWINLVALSDITGPPGSGGGGGGGTWGSITGSISAQTDLAAILLTKQPVGPTMEVGLATDIINRTIPNTFSFIQTSGYSNTGKGAARYQRTDSTGLRRWRFQSADGAYWVLSETYLHADMFGAVGDGLSGNAGNNAIALNAATDFARQGTGYRGGRGTMIHFDGGGDYMVNSKIVIHTGVVLTDSRVQSKGGFNLSTASSAAITIQPGSLAADSFMIVTDNNASGWGINGLQIVGEGVGAASTSGGIKVYGIAATDWRITNNTIKGWGIEGLIANGTPYTIQYNMIQACNNISYLVAKGVPTGSIRASGADGTIMNNEFTGGANQGSGGTFLTPSADQLVGAAHFGGLGVSKLAFNIYQVAECGLRHPGGDNRFTSERFDTNGGSGIYMTSGGSNNIFQNCQVIRNSLANPNTYDGIFMNTNGGKNYFFGTIFGAGAPYGGATVAMRYYINDQKVDLTSNEPFVNYYEGSIQTTPAGTGFYNASSITEASPSFTINRKGPFRRVAGDRPDVLNKSNLMAFNTTNTTIVNLIGGVPGQEISLTSSPISGGSTWVKHGDSIKLRKGVDSIQLSDIKVEKFVFTGRFWLQTTGAEAGEGTWQPLNLYLTQLASLTPGNGAFLSYDNGWKTFTSTQQRGRLNVYDIPTINYKVDSLGALIGSGGGGGTGVTDGDKGDITVSGGGTVWNVDVGLSATKIGANTNVSNTEYGYLDGVSSPIQTQINGRASTQALADSMTALRGSQYLNLGFGLNYRLSDTALVIDTASAGLKSYIATYGGGGGSAPTTDASALTTGTLNDARLSSNVTQNTATQTLTNKTLSAPVFSGAYSFGGTPTFPTAVTQNTATQTLTNKTMDGGSNTFTNIPATALPNAGTSAAGILTANQYNRLYTRQTSANPTGTITVNVNNGAQIGITFTATGARTLAFSNHVAGDLVKIAFDNTSGATVALTLPSNSFSAGTGSAASVTIPTGKSVLSLVDYDGTNYYFSLQSY